MKKIMLFFAVAFSFCASAKPLIWNKKNDFEIWRHFQNAKGEKINGVIRLTEIRSDSMIISRNVSIDPRKYNTFTFTYRATGTGSKNGQFFFAHGKEKFSDARRWRIPPLNNDGEWHTVSVSPTDFTAWLEGGPITKLRFDPTDSPGGEIEISEIKLEKRNIVVPPTVKVKNELDGPAWPSVKSELWSTMNPLKREQPYFEGKMVRAPQDVPGRKSHQIFFLRRVFDLKEKPVQGWLQYTADDCAEAFINGKSAGTSNNWRTCTTKEITSLLKSGKNVLALKYFNQDSYGGVLFEVYVQYADGACERIRSDSRLRCSVAAASDWMRTDFNDSGWLDGVEQDPPPASPWGIVLPYRYFNNMQKIISASVIPSKITAGETIRIKIVCEGKIPTENIPASIVLNPGTTSLWREDLSIDKKYFVPVGNGRWVLDFPYATPLYLNSAKVSISLESNMFSASPENWKDLVFQFERIRKDPNFPEKMNFRVVRKNGSPQFQYNGKPFFPVWLYPHHLRYTHQPVRANLVTVNVFNGRWWNSDKIETVCFDETAEKYRRMFPEALFIWNIRIAPPEEWADINPSEIVLEENGKPHVHSYLVPFSYSSVKARQQFEKIIGQVIHYLESAPYANRIAGYRITGGFTAEWLGWESKNSVLDFSEIGKKAFVHFAQTKYPHLQDVSVPVKAERHALDGNSLLWDQQKHLKAIAYNDFISNEVLDMLIPLCRKVRSIVGENKIVGTYYGYTSTLHHTGRSQYRAHYALKRFLDAKCVDTIASPQSYQLRNLGETCGDMKPFGTLQAHNIIPACEDDTRTHNGISVMNRGGSRTQTVTPDQSVALERRNMGIAICRLLPAYFYPLTLGTELAFPRMRDEIAVIRAVGEHCLAVGTKRQAEVAMVVSEESIKSMPPLFNKSVYSGIIDQFYNADGSVQREPRRKTILTYETFIGNLDRFSRAGTPVDQILAEDLADNSGQYKLYVFLNCFKYDDKFVHAVRQLRKRKCVLLWLYAPGFIKGGDSSTANMKLLTGMDFEKLDSPIVPAVSFANGKTMGTPGGVAAPMFAVISPQAEPLGHYSNGKIGAAALPTDNALSVFSGPWQLSIDFIRSIMKRAGIFCYTESDDPIEANDSLIVIHARYPGRKWIRLPRKADILDVFERKIIARNVDRFSCDMKLHETKYFYYGPEPAGLLTKIRDLTGKP